jgi:predicted nuclease of predicted toxin-antitoxin system
MRFLADENFPAAAVVAIRQAGHDIVWIAAAAPGESDANVLAWAARDGRVLLTFDKDFGELAKVSRLPNPCGASSCFAYRFVRRTMSGGGSQSDQVKHPAAPQYP